MCKSEGDIFIYCKDLKLLQQKCNTNSHALISLTGCYVISSASISKLMMELHNDGRSSYDGNQSYDGHPSYQQKCTRNPHIWWPSIIYLTILIENLTLSCLDPHWPAGPCTSNHIEDYDGTSSYDDFPSYDDSPSYDDFPSIQQILIWWVAIILIMIIVEIHHILYDYYKL